MISKNRIFLFLVVGLACLAAGCAALPEKKSFDKAHHKDIRTIALLNVEEPAEYRIETPLPPGLLFTLGEMARIKETSKIFKEAAVKYIPPLGPHLEKYLEEKLRLSGYEVKKVGGLRTKRNALVEDYSKIKVEADAFLDVVLWAGYYSRGTGPKFWEGEKFEPAVRVLARMVSGSTGEVIYFQYVLYGQNFGGKNKDWHYLPCEKKLVYKEFGAILADEKQAAEELQIGTEAIGDYLARTLAK